MKVILLKDVSKVGVKNEVKDVADGYALNFLLPKGMAECATDKKLQALSMHEKEATVYKEVEKKLLESNVRTLTDVRVVITAKANEAGHLYEGVHKGQIMEELKKQARIELSEEHILLQHPIKEVGEKAIDFSVDGQNGSFVLVVERE